MIPELSIVKVFLDFEVYNRHKHNIAVADLPKELHGVARTLFAHHENNPGTSLSVEDLANLYFATSPPNRDFMVGVFDNLNKIDVREDTSLELIKGIRVNNLMREISLASYDVAEGRKAREEVDKLLEQLDGLKNQNNNLDGEEEFEFVSTDLEELVNAAIRKPGLRWRLSTLNHMLGSLRKGDFGFLFARPETGKTTFLASEVTFMAEQACQQSLGPVLWFNNEEQGDKVMLRCIQAALGLDMVTLYRDLKGHKAKFLELTGGQLKMLDRAHISHQTVEKACEKYNPSLIVFDQIDKIVGFSNDREDLRLGTIYQWARELSKEYAPAIGVCQADGSGEGVKWLTMGNVANAKTAKQAEADWILGIGKTNDSGFENLRFLHASKNKLLGDEDSKPDMRHGKKEVIIEADIARYRDIG